MKSCKGRIEAENVVSARCSVGKGSLDVQMDGGHERLGVEGKNYYSKLCWLQLLDWLVSMMTTLMQQSEVQQE